MLDQLSLMPAVHDAAFQEFQDGKSTYQDALQRQSARAIQAGWVPMRITVSNCEPVKRWRHPHYREPK